MSVVDANATPKFLYFSDSPLKEQEINARQENECTVTSFRPSQSRETDKVLASTDASNPKGRDAQINCCIGMTRLVGPGLKVRFY